MSKRTQIALGLMAELAIRDRKKPLVLASVAHKLNTSASYLEAITARLRTAGLVEATRGPGGGYLLAKQAAEVSILEIVLTVESSNRIFKDVLSKRLHGGEADDLTQTFFERTESAAAGFLEKLALSDLIAHAPNPMRSSTPWPTAVQGSSWPGNLQEADEEVLV